MSLNYGESTNLRNIAADMKKAATSLATLVKILETMNTNLVVIGRDLAPPKAASKVGLPEGWNFNDRVRVADPSREEFGLDGVIVDGRIWSTSVELCVRFGQVSMSSRTAWFNPGQLEKNL